MSRRRTSRSRKTGAADPASSAAGCLVLLGVVVFFVPYCTARSDASKGWLMGVAAIGLLCGWAWFRKEASAENSAERPPIWMLLTSVWLGVSGVWGASTHYELAEEEQREAEQREALRVEEERVHALRRAEAERARQTAAAQLLTEQAFERQMRVDFRARPVDVRVTHARSMFDRYCRAPRRVVIHRPRGPAPVHRWIA